MHERPSRYPHSPNSRQNQEGTASHADTQQRAEAIQSHIPDKQTASLWLTRQWQAPKFRSRAPAWEPSTCDSPEVARRGTKAQRERPSRRYPHSPNIQELASAPRRMPKLYSDRPVSTSQSNTPEPQTPNPCRHPHPARQPPTGASWRAGCRGAGCRAMGWLEASQRGHGTNLKSKHTHPKFGAAGRGLSYVSYLIRPSRQRTIKKIHLVAASEWQQKILVTQLLLSAAPPDLQEDQEQSRDLLPTSKSPIGLADSPHAQFCRHGHALNWIEAPDLPGKHPERPVSHAPLDQMPQPTLARSSSSQMVVLY